MLKYTLITLGRLFGGLAIMFISFIVLLMGAAFFLTGCNFDAWTAMFTNPEGLTISNGVLIALMAVVTLVFLIICMKGFYLMLSSSRTDIGDEDVVQVYQSECQHDTVHQVGFTNLLKCDECGATFVNPHFIS